MIRVAAAQFAVGTNIDDNLNTCLRMIDKAAKDSPQLLALPEFCNHCAWYEDRDHSYQVAVSLQGEFVTAVGKKAKQHQCYIMLNCTVKRPENTVTGTNILFDPSGEIIATSDKQVLMGNENNFLSKAETVCPVIETPLGRLGMYSCMDGVIFETSHGIALRGAQILCNSLNSFANDEANLHIPVRAGENKVYIVAANKVGPLVPEHLAQGIAERMQIPVDYLHGAGESQIVAPDGAVLAKAPASGEAVVYADIEASAADDKTRPDGTHIFTSRRPELYAPIAEKPENRDYAAGPEEIVAGVYQPERSGMAAVDEVTAMLADYDPPLLVLPELFFVPDRLVNDPDAVAQRSNEVIRRLADALKTSGRATLVATSVVRRVNAGHAHVGVALDAGGVVLEQMQLHQSKGFSAWQTIPGDSQPTIDTPSGRVALVVGQDAIYPETFRLLTLKDVEIVLCPTHIQEQWEAATGFLERAAENRMNLAVASRPSDHGQSLIVAIDHDFTLWTEWKKRPFDGNINYPVVTTARSGAGLTTARIYPAAAGNRMVSQQTDVVESRPYWLVDAIVKA